MNKEIFNRRQFLQQAGVAGGALLFESAIFGDSLGMASALAQPTVLIRKDIDTLTEPEIAALRKGVSVMKSRSDSSPTSWIFQANIHGAPQGSALNPAWRKCQHGSFFFLAWHRMYLHFFERILHAASESPNLTLPYWNYSKDTTEAIAREARALPKPFRNPTDGSPPTANPLFVAQRAPGINSGLSRLPASTVRIGPAMETANFTNFGRRLESTPHNDVHNGLGGLMGSGRTAARDPIFWLHHANIDRLWNQWLSMGGGRVNPVASAEWTTPRFNFFTETGAPVTMSACQILNSATQLGYRYDTDSASVGGLCSAPILADTHPTAVHTSHAQQKTIATRQANVVLGERPVCVGMALGSAAKSALNSAAASDSTYILSVEGITYTRQPGVHFEVYIDLPAGIGDPDWNGVHYIGNLSFFKTQSHRIGGSHTAHDNANQTFDITEVVRNLRARNLWNENRLSVTFVARGLDNLDGTRQKPIVLARPKFTGISLVVE